MSSRPRYIDLPRRGVVKRSGGVHSAASASAGELRWKGPCGVDALMVCALSSRFRALAFADLLTGRSRVEGVTTMAIFEDFEVVLASWRMLQFQSTKFFAVPKLWGMGVLSTKVRRSSTYYRLISSIISYLHSQHP